MKTSFFGGIGKKKGAIAICLYPPRRSKILHYPDLAPSASLLDWYKSQLEWGGTGNPERHYTEEFLDQLFDFDAQAVWNELHELANGHEPILLCYEKPGYFCHRRLVASWFKAELGEVVEELKLAGVRE